MNEKSIVIGESQKERTTIVKLLIMRWKERHRLMLVLILGYGLGELNKIKTRFTDVKFVKKIHYHFVLEIHWARKKLYN